MKVIVFGGAGFLGSHVADALSDRGHEVTIFDLRESEFLRPEQKMMIGNIQDSEEVSTALKGMDVAYHFAGIADIHEAQINPKTQLRQILLVL